MKLFATVAVVATCISIIGFNGLSAFAKTQSSKLTVQRMAEASDGDGETNDDAQSQHYAPTQSTLIQTLPASVASTSEETNSRNPYVEETDERHDTEVAEPPSGDSDGETNDDG